jgi:photosystem I P700 chlorophyll a apoprotein A2
MFTVHQRRWYCNLNILRWFPSSDSSFILCIAHHQLAIAVVFIVAGHMYRTNFGIGHNMKEILDAHRPPGGRLGAGHTGVI